MAVAASAEARPSAWGVEVRAGVRMVDETLNCSVFVYPSMQHQDYASAIQSI